MSDDGQRSKGRSIPYPRRGGGDTSDGQHRQYGDREAPAESTGQAVAKPRARSSRIKSGSRVGTPARSSQNSLTIGDETKWQNQ
jgi:hypothetical protein